ncbi:response regulator transcription factor [Mariprofundus sp. NF]|uniref:LuxR C-terminal-related transcriptional regulator n=1 Tax=Mariprofundus sp. NF TaxID=2608716 RepID=UPI0015A31FD0|nr:response regulator transcription factor [Mariprofundus sp. NF]NWF39038.1 response regulator transcription factor [Mariprofundus sp. NF]
MKIQLISETTLIHDGLLCLLDSEEDLSVITPQVKCSPPSCYQSCHSDETDLIVIDTTSGKYSCIDCIRQVTRRHPDVKILVIIWREQFTLVNEALHNGAKGVLSMEANQALLTQAIREVAAGQQFIDPSLQQALAEVPYQQMINPFDILSEREKTVLQLILKGNNTEECATRLHISKKTVANHRTQINKKMAVHDLGQLTRLAIRHNLIKPV